jgi:predicted SnoaL-like aldol condensation-catalyzing enzyme
MRFSSLLFAGVLAPAVLAAPTGIDELSKREDLCKLKTPPVTCQPDPTVSVAETAARAYKFYRAFVVDGDPRTMFSLIDSVYKQNSPGYSSGPNAIWPLFCNGKKIGTEANTAWCFDASTNMSYARYSVTDRWRWVDGCVHEHWDRNEKIPSQDKCYKLPTNATKTA